MAAAGGRNESGFTMLEVIVGAFMAIVCMSIAIQTTRVTGEATTATIARSNLDQRAHRLLGRLSRELMEARLESIVPAPDLPLGASGITFQCAELDGAGNPVWGTLRRIELVASQTDPSDGLDNDDDGLVDEHDVHLIDDWGLISERHTVICRGVAGHLEGETLNSLDDNANELIDERGLSFVLIDGVLWIRVTLMALKRGGEVIVRTAETALMPRN